MTRHGNTTLAVFIATLSTALLVGLRFDALWAGGPGRISPCPATLISEATNTDTTIMRGEVMQTVPGQYLKYQLCDGAVVYLDENTQIKLTAYWHEFDPSQLELLQGRVIIDGVANVKARNVAFATAGAACEFVHYSWRDELDVTPLVESACAGTQTTSDVPSIAETSRFNTFTGAKLLTLPFRPETSSAQSFYAWTGLAIVSGE